MAGTTQGLPSAAGIAGRIPHHRAVAIVYAGSMFMSVMDTQIVNVALPTMSHDFHVPISSVQWVVTAYLMSIAVCVPASGWLGDRFGTKRIYLLAVASFTIASLLCAMSSNLPELVITRVLQGVGGGAAAPGPARGAVLPRPERPPPAAGRGDGTRPGAPGRGAGVLSARSRAGRRPRRCRDRASGAPSTARACGRAPA